MQHAQAVSLDLLLAYRPPDPGPTNITSSDPCFSSGTVIWKAGFAQLKRTPTPPASILNTPRIILHTARQTSRAHRTHRARPSATDSGGDSEGEPAPSPRLRAAA